jgi:hypothetical protein
MNPHACTKRAGRLLMALAAISSILLMAACGSGNPITVPNPEGFNNGSLNGTYVISIAGTDVNSSEFVVPFAIVGTIQANGKGGITTGTIDINDPGNTGVNLAVAVSSSGSSYNVSTDGRGTGTLATTVATFSVDFVLTSTNHGLITRFDNLGTGSGTIDLQSSASQSSLGSLAFSLSGADSQDNPLGTVGGLTLNSSTGAISSGTQDYNDGITSGAGFTNLPLSGQVVLAASGTTGTATLTTSFGSFAFDVWVIDSAHLKFIETDTGDTKVILAGDAFTQLTSFSPGQEVFTLTGFDGGLLPVVAGGYVTVTDANGDLSNGVEDYNDAGTGTLGKVFNGAGACDTSTGRCQTLLNGFTNGSGNQLTFAYYPSSGGALALEIDSFGLLQGAAYSQSATSFTAPAGYALNLSGNNTDGQGDIFEVDDIAQFNATTAASPAVNMTGVLDENSLLGGPLPNKSLNPGTYTPDSIAPPDGRGTIVATTNNTYIGGVTLQYYVVDSSTAVFIEVDQDQFTVGTFQAQSTPSSAAMAQSHIALVHAAARPHAALRRK